MAQDLKNKIRKLLALAHSPNEHEAKAALLKARELMAEHKLTEAECAEAASKKVKNIRTKWSCSKRRDPWLIQLSGLIGEHYCCKGYRTHYSGKQTQEIGFIGLEDDVEVCVEIFDYAARCVSARTKEIKKELSGYFTRYIRREADSYGYGFCAGLSEAYEEQRRRKEKDESGWGLVLVIPKEVEEATKHLGNEEFRARTEEQLSGRSLYEGYEAGKKFDPGKVLKEAEREQTLALR